MSDLTQPLWGTGYGNHRHLADQVHVGYRGRLWPRCGANSPLVTLTTGSSGDRSLVESRPPCARCQKIADREAQV